jgi:Glucose-6-phosphate dehydrogenase, NAD binding domain
VHDGAPQADALVFFGAPGELAYKKIFPALHAMVRRGHLDVPVVGVARSGWTLELCQRRLQEPVTFQALRKELGPALRIVPDAPWHRAHERLRGVREGYQRATGGVMHGRPLNGVESKYLLTGLRDVRPVRRLAPRPQP